MDLFDISIVRKDAKQDNLYDLIDSTFVFVSKPVLTTIVTKEQEMRIDLISYELYNSTQYSDLILNLNDIDNPLNIKEGDTIMYITTDLIETYRITPENAAEKRRLLLSPNKANIKDPNRQAYIENNYQLPPTFLNTPGNPVTSNNSGSIIINPLV